VPGGVRTIKISSLERPFIVRMLLKPLRPISCGVAGKTKKNTFFKKQSGEVIDNKGLALKNKPKQTQKQSGEVVENTYLWKKQTQKQTWPCCWK
jgi:hypothetical protein